MVRSRCLLFRFSSKTLIRLCEQIEGKAIAGMVVIGENQAARSLTLAGTGMNIPVLWSKGGVAKMHGIGKEVSKYLKYRTFFSHLFSCLYMQAYYMRTISSAKNFLFLFDFFCVAF